MIRPSGACDNSDRKRSITRPVCISIRHVILARIFMIWTMLCIMLCTLRRTLTAIKNSSCYHSISSFATVYVTSFKRQVASKFLFCVQKLSLRPLSFSEAALTKAYCLE